MNKPVNFEIAKLLKEKGFESKNPYYNSSGEIVKTPDIPENDYSYTNNIFQKFRWEAPTIAEVVMWLYENHGIWICIDKAEDFNWWKFGIRKLNDIGYERNGFGSDFNTPTEAYEAAIKYTLENNLI